jgi:DNA-binding NarL/FixJ family response regulator
MDACILQFERRPVMMMKSKMVVLWDSEDILSSFIELFLSSKADWKIVSVSTKEDLSALILASETTQPDIVIIHQGRHNDPTNLPLQLLQDHPAVRVITISLEDNLMDVYSKQKVMVRQASDLISAIENAAYL